MDVIAGSKMCQCRHSEYDVPMLALTTRGAETEPETDDESAMC